MRRSIASIAAITLWLSVFLLTVVVRGHAAAPTAPQSSGWTIPANGAAEKNPLTVTPAVVAAGKTLFSTKCQRCHGALGKGDGEDGEPENQPDMDLTVAARAARNSDGTVFYKLWNGRTSPKMPAFSDQLTKEQAWSIVAYVQTLRAK
jgi:mono/diheme cytochrome c family protein